MFYEEVFLSIQGESTDTGLPCVFVRLFGCPVGCVYCDQKQDKKDKHRANTESIVNKVRKYRHCKRVCITGGEPLVYSKEVYPLVYELQTYGYSVSIETSGCFPVEDYRYDRSYKYIMDVKCPSSGVVEKNLYENLLKLIPKDEVVFVIKDRKDYDFMKSVLRKYPTSAKILLSPMFDTEGKQNVGKKIVEWLLEDGLDYRVQIQLHKILGVS